MKKSSKERYVHRMTKHANRARKQYNPAKPTASGGSNGGVMSGFLCGLDSGEDK